MSKQASSVQYTKLSSEELDDEHQQQDKESEEEVVIYSNEMRVSSSSHHVSDSNSNNQEESDEYEKTSKRSREPTNVRKDLSNIIFLMFLYMLQGVPLGLTGSLPFILGSRNVSYADQGTFSLAFWPFCLKLLWAPVVDSLFLRRFGRRKSWLVPMQYIMGFYMIAFSNYVHQILESNSTNTKQDIYTLTFIFFVLTFFAATQDIAVDGWGLTILSKENVAWSSTCNNTGQTAGWFIGNVVFLVFESADFSNKYFRPVFGLASQSYGLITIDKFMQFFGVLFLITTTLVLIFKREKETTSSSSDSSIEDRLTLGQTYKLVWKIFNLKSVRELSLILLTMKMAFAVQAMTYLKLIEQGVPKESLGLLAIPLTPLEIVLPLLISRFTNGPRPMTTLLKCYPFRIVTCSLMVFWCFLTPYFRDPVTREYPFYYFLICIVISGLNSSMVTTHSVSQVAFFTQISDKRVGGSMMTLLNTIANIGSGWPNTLILYLVDFISIKHCQAATTSHNDTNLSTELLTKINHNSCKNELETKACSSLGGKCAYTLDAFYLIAIVAACFGLFWLMTFAKIIRRLESQSKSAWKISFTF